MELTDERLKTSLNYVCTSRLLANYALDKGCILRSIAKNRSQDKEKRLKNPYVFIFKNTPEFQEVLKTWLSMTSEQKKIATQSISEKQLQEERRG